MQWQLIESDQALQQLLDRHARCETVVVDTEFMRRDTFYPEVALVQLSFVTDGESDDMAWLIDPLQITELDTLRALITNPSVIKVLHSASEDLEVFQRWLGVLPQPLFDTQRAAALLGLGFGLGYRALVDSICAIDLPKGETRSNWLQRPLTASQCEYAALDVTWLTHVWHKLAAQCARENKLPWVLADGHDAVTAMTDTPEAPYKRIKTAWKLSARQLATLMAVCQWREETARSRNKPRAWIIDDQACLSLATSSPKTLAELRSDIALPPPVLRRHADELLALLAQQRELADSDLPGRMPPPLTAAQRGAVKKLKATVRERAVQLAVVPEVLLNGRDYELLVREAAGEAVLSPVHWSGWRKEAVLSTLRSMLAQSR